jgi:hypothetical protein
MNKGEILKDMLKSYPKIHTIPDGSLNWEVQVISGRYTMRVGVMGTHKSQSASLFSNRETTISRYYTYGPVSVGGDAKGEKEGARFTITPTDTYDIFVMSGDYGSKTLQGREVFERCGFEAPTIFEG